MDQDHAGNRPLPDFPLLRFPFRLFFISSALVGAILIPSWLWVWTHGWLGLALEPVSWHQHEMLAGFANAAVAGFLLTAICNWTGTPPLSGRRLLGLWLLWLAGRLGMALGADFPLLAALLDLAFLPVVALSLGLRAWHARQRRQVVLLLVLMMLWGLDLLFHWTGDARFLHALVLLTALLILVIGGRITPTFTANWLRMQGLDPESVVSRPWLDRAGLVATLVLVVLEAGAWKVPALTGTVALLAALLVLARLVSWSGWRSAREPLLWLLHAGHLWVAIGFLLRSLAAFSLVPDSAWLHALGAGAMGTMILAVMTRVAVGHTGRPLRLRPGGLWAYGLILAAGMARVLVSLGWLPLMSGLWVASLAWSTAWLIFLMVYGPILMAPRADGKPG